MSEEMPKRWTLQNHLTVKKLLLDAFKPRKDLKKQYLKYIQDRKLPLNDRWDVFVAAPIDIKEEEPWIQEFDIEKKVGKFPWFDWGRERNETVDVSDFINNIDFEDNIGISDLYGLDRQFTIESLNEFKEEVLQKNIGSFNLDW